MRAMNNDKIREAFGDIDDLTIYEIDSKIVLDNELIYCNRYEIQHMKKHVRHLESEMQSAQEEIVRLKKEKEYSHVLVEFSETEDSKSTEVNISGYYDDSKSEAHQLIVKLVHAEIRKIVGKIWEAKK